MSIEIRKNYRDDKQLRDSFNELSEKTFGLSFENWYQNGYWKDNYNPYSVIVDGKVVANVSVNRINTMMSGEKKYFIQLGTVMTDEEYRGRGFIREILKEIDQDYADQCDGMYLFANDSVLDFYPKFGYHKATEYQYSKEVSNSGTRTVQKVPMDNKKDWDKIKAVIDKSQAFYGFDMVDNSDLDMFYLSQFMKDNVYYIEALDAYVVAEEEDELFIHAIFAEKKVSIEDVIKAFGSETKKVIFGFVPDQKEHYECNILQEEDTTLFVKGAGFENFSDEHIMFMTLSHA